jgi:hypothetical protein
MRVLRLHTKTIFPHHAIIPFLDFFADVTPPSTTNHMFIFDFGIFKMLIDGFYFRECHPVSLPRFLQTIEAWCCKGFWV